MVAIRPPRKRQPQPRTGHPTPMPKAKAKAKVKCKIPERRDTKRSYFFIGRQARPPYVYDRNLTPRASNVLWLVEDDLDYTTHHRLYRQEVEYELRASFCTDIDTKSTRGRVAGTERRGRQVTAGEQMDVKQQEEEGGKMEGIGGMGVIIDMTLSDDEDEDKVISEVGPIRPRVNPVGQGRVGTEPASEGLRTHWESS